MSWPATLSALVLTAALASAELTLASGSVVEGEILSESAGVVRVRVVQDGMSAERSWPQAEIVRIVRGPTARQQAVEALRGEAEALIGLPSAAGLGCEVWGVGPHPGTAAGLGCGVWGVGPHLRPQTPDLKPQTSSQPHTSNPNAVTRVAAATWLRLGRRARSLDEPALARSWALRATRIDRSLAEAQHLLGREEVNGVWMRPPEVAAARGLVRHEGRWVAWTERERQLAELADRRRQQQEAAAERRRVGAARAAATREASVAYDPPQPWSWRVDNPGRVLWWSGLPRTTWPTANCPGPLLRLGASGRWGGVDWNLRLNW